MTRPLVFVGSARSLQWVGARSSTAIEIGPFIEEADARLARSALVLFREDLDWELTEEEK